MLPADISTQMNGSLLHARKCPVWPLPAPRSPPLLTGLWPDQPGFCCKRTPTPEIQPLLLKEESALVMGDKWSQSALAVVVFNDPLPGRIQSQEKCFYNTITPSSFWGYRTHVFSPSCIGSTATYRGVLFLFLNLLEGKSKMVAMCLHGRPLHLRDQIPKGSL